MESMAKRPGDTNIHDRQGVVTDAIIGWLLDRPDRQYFNHGELCDQLPHSSKEISQAIRLLITTYGAVKRYTQREVYEIVDLERYFDPPIPGAHERWTKGETP